MMKRRTSVIFTARYLKQVKEMNDHFEDLMNQTLIHGCTDSHFLLKLAYHSFCQDIYHQLKDK